VRIRVLGVGGVLLHDLVRNEAPLEHGEVGVEQHASEEVEVLVR